MSDRPFVEHFSTITDPRQKGKILYPLKEIFILLLCAVLSNANDFEAIALYGEEKIDFLRQFSAFKNGIPRHDTISNILGALNPKQFQKSFFSWVRGLAGTLQGVVAIDGKTLRGSFDDWNSQKAIHVVSAWATETNLVLGQLKVEEKTNEITAIPDLLDLLSIKGCIVTIDAMGCQKEIAKKITEKKADYVLALKDNQPTLSEDVQLAFWEVKEEEGLKTLDKEHGRIEIRRYYMDDNIHWLRERHPDWVNLKSIGMVESTRIIKDKTSVERRFYITSLPKNLEKFAHAVRAHWGIENKVHWVLDVTFKEDGHRARIKNLPEIFSTLKRAAMNILRQDKSRGSLRGKRMKAGWNDMFLLSLLSRELDAI